MKRFKVYKLTMYLLALLYMACIPNSVYAQNQKPLPESLLPDLSRIGHMISAGNAQEQIQNAWKAVLNNSKDINVEAAINYILTDAKTSSRENAERAQKRVDYDSLLKCRLSDELKIAKAALSELNKTKVKNPLNRKIFGLKPDKTGNIPVKQNGIATTKSDIEAYIKELENNQQQVGDDAQLANVDLQNRLQKQQQTNQMISTISKMLSDTAMAVIRKFGG
jgi:hypothetical protein